MVELERGDVGPKVLLQEPVELVDDESLRPVARPPHPQHRPPDHVADAARRSPPDHLRLLLAGVGLRRRRRHLDQRGDGGADEVVPNHVLLVHVPVLGDAPVHAGARPLPRHEEPLAGEHRPHRQRPERDEQEELAEGARVGGVVADDGRDAVHEVGAEEAHPGDAGAPGHDAGELAVADGVARLVLALLLAAVRPGERDGEEGDGDGERHPPALRHLGHQRRHVRALDREVEDEEAAGERAVHLPDHHHHHRHQRRRQQHHPDHCNTCRAN
ncbi:hypothetical protein EE612_007777 [Oryza sativa]|nr:hypothetical protein EE612_007777 [Oryza sativa]